MLVLAITDEERTRGIEVGAARTRLHTRKGTPNNHRLQRGPEAASYDVVGATAACVMAGATGHRDRWERNAVGFANKRGDIGDGIHIRATTHDRPNGHLWIGTDDPDDHLYIVVSVSRDFTKLKHRGWMFGGEAKQKKWWSDDVRDRSLRDPCFAVPFACLHQVSTEAECRYFFTMMAVLG